MNVHKTYVPESDHALDRLVADATIAAYAVALELRETNSWVDLQLGLWDAMARTIRDWAGLRLQVPCRECPYRDSATVAQVCSALQQEKE